MWLQDEAGGIHAAVRGGVPSRLAGSETTRADASTVRTDDEGAIWVHADGATHRIRPLTRREAMERRLADSAGPAAAAHPELRAPMPGAVVAVHVADGARVRAGERVVTIEAMKMEHPVTAPHDGIASITVTTGEQVRRDQVLARVTASPAEAGPE
jgi:acetyl-CoA/propionyl-CoA carboxylase biotin carboxyl carrier protein